jgi:hypothetical protein
MRLNVDNRGSVEPRDGPQRGDNQTAWRTFNVRPAPSISCNLTASPTKIEPGESSTLTWTIPKGTPKYGTINGEPVTNIGTTFSSVITPTIDFGVVTYTLALTATDDDVTTCFTDVRVGSNLWEPPTIELGSKPGIVRRGSMATLEWSISDLSTSICTIAGPSLSTPLSISEETGRSSVGPIMATSNYTLLCKGGELFDDVSTSVKIEVIPEAYEI